MSMKSINVILLILTLLIFLYLFKKMKEERTAALPGGKEVYKQVKSQWMNWIGM